MNLLLAEENLGTIDVEAWIKHVCETPLPEPTINIIILALLSKLRNNRLLIEAHHIQSIPLTNRGHIILVFLYTELHWNQEALCQILARFLAIRRCLNDRYLHEFLLVYGDRIAGHVGRVLQSEFSFVRI
jgi:hypothetical protein